MKRKSLFAGIAASLGMLILILDGKTAVMGARDGLELCLRTVIPSLFPFFVLSNLLTTAFTGQRLSLFQPVATLCGVPRGGESLLITGFLGGYPVGAQAVTGVYRAGQISKAEAERLLAFCNNAGPAFLFGMSAALFPQRRAAVLLWGIHILSAVFTAVLLPAEESPALTLSGGKRANLTDAMQNSVRVMAYVCGWVILFRILIEFLERWVLWLLPVSAQVGITGLLELTNGCCALAAVASEPLRFVMCSTMLAAGGLCVTMQTLSVTEGLSVRFYFLGKGMQILFSLLLSAACMVGQPVPILAAMVFFVGILKKSKKRDSIRSLGSV